MKKISDYLQVNSEKIRKIAFWCCFVTGLISLALIPVTHRGDDMTTPAKLTRLVLAFSVMAMVYLFMIKRNIKYFFIFAMIFFFVISNLYLMSDVIFKGYDNNWDWGDFVWMASIGGNPLYGANYPPIAVLFFAACYTLMPPYADAAIFDYCRKYLVTFFFLFTVIAIAFLFEDLFKKNKNYRLFTICILLTSPMLYAYQRMNIIIVVLIFVMLFWRYMDSEKKWKKNAGLFFLALAANFKYYPAAYGLILLKKKRWKDAIICGAMAVIMFIVPGIIEFFVEKSGYNLFELTGGILSGSFRGGEASSITDAVTQAASLTADINAYFVETDNVVNSAISIKSILVRYLSAMSVSISTAEIISYVIMGLVAVITIISFFMTKEKYQEISLIAILCVMVVTSSCWYYAVFLLPAFAVFMQKEKFTLFEHIMFIMWIGTFGNFWGFLNFHFVQGTECLAVIWIMTVGNTVYRFIKDRKDKKNAVNISNNTDIQLQTVS